MTDRLLRARDVAELLDVSVETVLRWHRLGKLPGGHRLATNVLRFRESALETWLAGNEEGPGARGEVSPAPSAVPTRGVVSQLSPAPIGGEDV